MSTAEDVQQQRAARAKRRAEAVERALVLVREQIAAISSGEVCIVIRDGIPQRVDTRTGVAVRVDAGPLPSTE